MIENVADVLKSMRQDFVKEREQKYFPSLIHDYIERDTRSQWHPVVEIRQRGITVYAISAVKGYVFRVKAVSAASAAARKLANGG